MNTIIAMMPFPYRLLILFGFIFVSIILTSYSIYKKQRCDISKLNKILKFKNEIVSVETDGQYSAELINITKEIQKIRVRIGDKFDELLTSKAAKYYVRRMICQNNVSYNIAHYFPDKNVKTFLDFVNELQGPPHNPDCLTDSDIGERCIILFLIHDLYMPEMKLYNNITCKALDIAQKFSPDSSFTNFFCVAKKPQYLDIIKDCKNPPQNRTEIIGRIKEYLGSITAYLETEGFFKE
jgi:hypothetical protein